MTLEQLVARYEKGTISDHEFAVESLNQIDPAHASVVLKRLPPAIFPQLREWVEHYRPGHMLAHPEGRIPSAEQVEAARKWLETAADPDRLTPLPTRYASATPTAERPSSRPR